MLDGHGVAAGYHVAPEVFGGALIYCRNCEKEVDPDSVLIPSGPHYGKYTCPYCKNYLGFIQKPRNENKRAKQKYKPSDFDVDFCQMCLRKKENLGIYESLEIHHVWPIEDNGSDEKGNIWIICTHCHKLVHHIRTYLNDHFKFLWEKYE